MKKWNLMFRGDVFGKALCLGVLAGGLVSFSSCSSITPVVPFYDRHTVMEAEAAGEWPDYDALLLKNSVHLGPSFLPKDLDQEGRKRALNSMHGEMRGSE